MPSTMTTKRETDARQQAARQTRRHATREQHRAAAAPGGSIPARASVGEQGVQPTAGLRDPPFWAEQFWRLRGWPRALKAKGAPAISAPYGRGAVPAG